FPVKLSEDPLKREAYNTPFVFFVKVLFNFNFKLNPFQPANHLTLTSLEPPAEACVVSAF
ncbi:MAG: hypothetical protein ACJA13_002784, partial [Paraglaciecola sp.]